MKNSFHTQNWSIYARGRTLHKKREAIVTFGAKHIRASCLLSDETSLEAPAPPSQRKGFWAEVHSSKEHPPQVKADAVDLTES